MYHNESITESKQQLKLLQCNWCSGATLSFEHAFHSLWGAYPTTQRSSHQRQQCKREGATSTAQISSGRSSFGSSFGGTTKTYQVRWTTLKRSLPSDTCVQHPHCHDQEVSILHPSQHLSLEALLQLSCQWAAACRRSLLRVSRSTFIVQQ